MLCQECGKKQASVHVTQTINNQKTERYMCEDCAALGHQLNINFAPNFSLQQFLTNLLNYDQSLGTVNLPTKEAERCPACGITYEQVVQGGKLGCSHCYLTFDNRIDGLLKHIHGSSNHVGKVPKRTGGKYRLQRDLVKLREQMNEHIKLEEFESAAKIRDQIKTLEAEMGE